MTVDAIARLEELVDRLLTERVALQERNRELSEERDRLLLDRSRVSDELGELLEKLERLEEESA